MKTIECHEEKIHLSGHIQDLGMLLIFQDDHCIATSENAFINTYSSSTLIGISLNEIL